GIHMRAAKPASRCVLLGSVTKGILVGALGIAVGARSVLAQPGAGGGRGAGAGRGAAAPPGPCVEGVVADVDSSGSGPHKVVIETKCAAGIENGTIYRPADLRGAEKYPIFVWGNGGCSQNGLSNRAAMSEIASHGYFVVADGRPRGGGGGGGRMGMAQG